MLISIGTIALTTILCCIAILSVVVTVVFIIRMFQEFMD